MSSHVQLPAEGVVGPHQRDPDAGQEAEDHLAPDLRHPPRKVRPRQADQPQEHAHVVPAVRGRIHLPGALQQHVPQCVVQQRDVDVLKGPPGVLLGLGLVLPLLVLLRPLPVQSCLLPVLLRPRCDAVDADPEGAIHQVICPHGASGQVAQAGLVMQQRDRDAVPVHRVHQGVPVDVGVRSPEGTCAGLLRLAALPSSALQQAGDCCALPAPRRRSATVPGPQSSPIGPTIFLAAPLYARAYVACPFAASDCGAGGSHGSCSPPGPTLRTLRAWQTWQ